MSLVGQVKVLLSDKRQQLHTNNYQFLHQICFLCFRMKKEEKISPMYDIYVCRNMRARNHIITLIPLYHLYLVLKISSLIFFVA